MGWGGVTVWGIIVWRHPAMNCALASEASLRLRTYQLSSVFKTSGICHEPHILRWRNSVVFPIAGIFSQISHTQHTRQDKNTQYVSADKNLMLAYSAETRCLFYLLFLYVLYDSFDKIHLLWTPALRNWLTKQKQVLRCSVICENPLAVLPWLLCLLMRLELITFFLKL